MLKAKTSQGDLILGLSKENVKRLQEDKPIHIRGSDLGLDHDIYILYGKTESSIADQLKEAGMLNKVKTYKNEIN